jgi:hypothetical protein
MLMPQAWLGPSTPGIDDMDWLPCEGGESDRLAHDRATAGVLRSIDFNHAMTCEA